MNVLIVDDMPEIRSLLRSYMELRGHQVMDAENGMKGLELAALHPPDLIISDILMPVMDGFQFLKSVKSDEMLKSVPFIFYSAIYQGEKDQELAFSLGADGFILKPKGPDKFWKEVDAALRERELKNSRASNASLMEHEEEYLRVYSQVVTAKLEEKVRELESALEERKKVEEELRRSEQSLRASRDAFFNMLEDVSESYKDMRELFLSLVTSMVNALDAKSPWTKGHSVRVAMYAEEIAGAMGFDAEEVKRIRLAGMLHDIGKIGTYDQLLDKPSRLTDKEFAIVMKHPVQGAEILKGIKQLRHIIPIIRHHHERMDGRGYPDRISGDEIPLEARILHVADSFDSMTADRPYRPSPGKDYAISELKRCSGTQFDPGVVKTFLSLLHID